MLSWRLHVWRLRLGAGLAWVVGGFVFTIMLAAVAPLALGLTTYSVRSGSMSPAIETGDIVVVGQIDPNETAPGDIVTFKDPSGSGNLITHRVRTVSEKSGVFDFVTRGDANNTSEHWSVPADGSIGAVTYRVPLLGYGLNLIGSSHGQLGLIAIPAALLCLLGLIRIWRPEKVGVPTRRRLPDLVYLLQFRKLYR